MTKEDYILQCRFYNGEEKEPKCPNQNSNMFWYYEQCWVLQRLKGKDYSFYFNDHPSIRDYEVEDGTPQDLKALLCDRYCHWGGDERTGVQMGVCGS